MPCANAAALAWLGLPLAVDLSAAPRRQASGMRRALGLSVELAAGLAAASGEYSAFLTEASRSPRSTLEPTLAVDLLWHTHMLIPRKYTHDCLRLTGMLLQYDDEVRSCRKT